jgi:hypothetical protein
VNSHADQPRHLPIAVPLPDLAEPDDIDEWLRSVGDEGQPVESADPPIHSLAGDAIAKERNGLRFRSAKEICASVGEQIEFAAAYLAFGAITELDGKPKAAGKTTFVLAMIGAILAGEPFLGHPTTKGPVVMLTEQPPASLRAALVRAGLAQRDDFILLSWAEAAGSAWPEIVAKAEEACRNIGARVLVVDTLPQFAGLRGDAENNAGDALEAIGPLQLLAADGFAVLVTRHDRKAGGEVGESARGSGAFTGAVDIVLALGREPQASRPTMRHLGCLSRFEETKPDLVIELVGARYEVIGTSAEALAAAQREKLLGALSGEPTALAEIAEVIGEPPAAVRALLNTLFAEDLVARHGAGRKGDPYSWSLPGGDGDGFPFVPLRGTHERKAFPPNPRDDSALTVEDDYPPSAFEDQEN